MSLNSQSGGGVDAGGRQARKLTRQVREKPPHASIVKVIEVLAESGVSWEDAASRALEAARRSVRNIKSIYVSDLQAIVGDARIVGFRLNAKISFAVEDHEQEVHVARDRLRVLREEKPISGENIMANREFDDSRYNRNEGRFENRDEWRENESPTARDWDRRDEYQSEGRYAQREGRNDPLRSGYQPTYGSSGRDQRIRQGDWNRTSTSGQDYGQSRYDQDFRLREGNYGNQDWRSPQSYNQDWRSGQDWRSQQQTGFQQGQRNFNQDWRAQGFNQDWRGRDDYRSHQDSNRDYSSPDYYRSQGDYGSRGQGYGPSYRQGWSGQGFRGSESFRGGERDEESWGEQIRHAGQQVARTVKRAFRGPKGYRRSDERIREDVSDRLAAQDQLDPSDIEVSVSNGEVTLTGTVQGRHEKFLAEEIADDIGGVNDVHNQLRVRREEIGTTSTTSTSTTAGVGQSETTLRNRNAPRA